MPQPLIDLYTSLTTRNWFASAALAVMIGTQLLKSLPWLRAKIWLNIPVGYRWSVPVIAGSLTAFVHGFEAHETAAASVWDALKIALSAMGGAAALKESPLPWSGLAGGAPALAPARPLPIIPPLHDASDDEKTPVDGHQPPPPNAA
ncbi:MAG TPA: hypothetical protein VK571_11025 [Gemmatimonadaceae bacterium]|nr:hypothetical protein [Gemmatimonadaceae bacterium]